MHIDWTTLALQTVNVLILIWILGRFFFRPVADLVTRRREAASKLLADADFARKEADRLRTEAAQLEAAVNVERNRLIDEARKAADAEKAVVLAQLSAETEKRREDERTAIARQRAAMERDVLDHANELSIDIARRLLERLSPDVAFSAFLGGIQRALGKLSPEAQTSLMASDPGHPIDVITATALSKEQTTALRDILRAALGVEPAMRIASDRALIAGIEIRSRNLILRNNWRADLDQISRELDR